MVTFNKAITFENINFSYHDNEDMILRNVNLELKKNDIIGVFGKSGSGKSTFVDLLSGLIRPTNGKILVDGKKIQDVKSNWQKIIGCVPQEVFILDDSLKRNIAFGLPNELIDVEKVNKAIELAKLTEFKNTLNPGLETLLGESGSRLSGGQRQRIGIARALYHNPNILIFDEATSALDNETEQEVMKAIEELGKEKTMLIIAHRLTTLKGCDKIISLEKNNIIQTLTYEEVVSLNSKK